MTLNAKVFVFTEVIDLRMKILILAGAVAGR